MKYRWKNILDGKPTKLKNVIVLLAKDVSSGGNIIRVWGEMVVRAEGDEIIYLSSDTCALFKNNQKLPTESATMEMLKTQMKLGCCGYSFCMWKYTDDDFTFDYFRNFSVKNLPRKVRDKMF